MCIELWLIPSFSYILIFSIVYNFVNYVPKKIKWGGEGLKGGVDRSENNNQVE